MVKEIEIKEDRIMYKYLICLLLIGYGTIYSTKGTRVWCKCDDIQMLITLQSNC